MDSSNLQRIKLRYGIVGNCEALDRALDIALKIAPVDLSVLVTGENGVGKEVFPRIIHDHSLRKNKKYFAVNCGAIPEGTIDSELFGHEKGAFTGAVERREGYFAVANGGTLFLDEVGELPAPTQARLLRVLETGEYIPVGASEIHKTDVRIVAATNVNMEKAIGEGKFREDLYYRLNSVSISVPALRERGDDVLLLFRKFALEMSEKYKMPPIRLDDEASRILVAYSWPGNVRQLKNVAENMSVTSEARVITPEILRRYLPEPKRHDQIIAVDDVKRENSFENEREILYQILFDLRRDVSELKRIVCAQQQEKEPSGEISESKLLSLWKDPSVAFKAEHIVPEEVPQVQEVEEVKANDVPANGPATPPPSLEELKKDVVRKALIRNNGNRRQTAEQLGISERTLYRKIKEYDLG